MVPLVLAIAVLGALNQEAAALPQVKPSLGFIPGAGAPAYLQVEGHGDCLGRIQPDGATHMELCMPAEKPESCLQEAWDQLGKVFKGLPCHEEGRQSHDGEPTLDVGVGAPAYLQVEGHQDCLGRIQPEGATHIELCLPAEKPESCLQESWEQLGKVFKGLTCEREGRQSALGVGVGAPAYLQVEGHQECLGSIQPEGATHTEVCLPVAKPETCLQEAWDQLGKVFKGRTCEREGRQSGFSIEAIKEEAKNNLPLIVCKADSDCPANMSKCFAASGKSVCIPDNKSCSKDEECVTIGDNAVGSLHAKCKDQVCEYERFFILA